MGSPSGPRDPPDPQNRPKLLIWAWIFYHFLIDVGTSWVSLNIYRCFQGKAKKGHNSVLFFTPQSKEFRRQSTKTHLQTRADPPKRAQFRHVFYCSVEGASQAECNIDSNEPIKTNNTKPHMDLQTRTKGARWRGWPKAFG